MHFVYEIVTYYHAIVYLSQLSSNPHLRHIIVLCVQDHVGPMLKKMAFLSLKLLG